MLCVVSVVHVQCGIFCVYMWCMMCLVCDVCGMCVVCVCLSAGEDQKRALYPLGLGSQLALSCVTWLLETVSAPLKEQQALTPDC